MEQQLSSPNNPKLNSKDFALFLSPKKLFSQQTEIKQKEQDIKTTEKKTDENSEILMIINIDIGKDQEAELIIRKNYNIYEIASEFCKTHQLDEKLINVLAENINQQIQNFNSQNRKNDISSSNLYKNMSDGLFFKQKEDNFSLKKYSSSSNPNFAFKPNINQISEELMRLKNRDKVYNRLYLDATLKLKKSQVKNDLLEIQDQIKKVQKTAEGWKSFNSTNGITSGLKMYQQAMIKLEKNKDQENNHKKRIEEESLQECTHHPKVNNISKMIMMYKRKDENEKIEKYLLKYGDIKKEKINNNIKIQKVKEMENCTFHPKINKLSADIFYANKNPEKTVYDQLYDENRQIQIKKEEIKRKIDEKLNFTPEINKFSSVNSKIINDFNFIQRMELFENIRKEKLKNNILKNNEDTDPYTNQKLFHPVICSNQPNESSYIEKRWENLYNRRHEKDKKIESILLKEKEESNKPMTSQISCKLIEEKRKNVIVRIFGLLDSDKDGIISYEKIEINALSEETLKILEPLFLLLNETKGEMELEEFYLCFLKILNTLCWAEKNELFDNFEERKKIKNKDNLQNCPFMPKISEESRKLADSKHNKVKEQIYRLKSEREKIEENKQKTVRKSKLNNENEQK